MRKSAHPHATRRHWWSCLALVLGLLAAAGAVAASASLDGAWRPLRAGDTPTRVMQDYAAGQLTRFDPRLLHRFPPPATGAWVVIVPQPVWDSGERVLAVDPPPWGAITTYTHDLAVAQTLQQADSNTSLAGHGRLAWQLPVDHAPALPILLQFQPATLSPPVRFALQPLGDYLQRDANWLVFASACFAVMLAMVLMALCFALMLRDVAYAWYAACLLGYALVQGTRSGYVFQPLDWQWLADSTASIHSAATALSVAFAALFMTRFCDLQRHAPLLRVPVLALAVAMVQLVLLRASDVSWLLEVENVLFSPLLTLGALLLPLAAFVAGLRGSRPAWFFLVGLAPLLLFTAAGDAQFNGDLAGWTWLGDASLAAGALEAIVLSVGVADHALSMRQDRDVVRALADHDALTDVYNRRAWSERASAALAASNTRPMALLFLDLDHFKALNDHLGHHSGDRALTAVAEALTAELRPQDLLGRYGGEEFVVLLDATAVTQAIQVATRLCRRVHRLEIPVNADSTLLTVSIGVAMRLPVDNLEALVERADQAMYSAKINGRNQVCVHQSSTVHRLPNQPARRDSDR